MLNTAKNRHESYAYIIRVTNFNMASSHQLLFNPAPYFRPKPSSLKIGDEISRGSYGSVSCGELDGTPVAVKRIHGLLLEAAKGQGDFKLVMSSFQRECQLLEQVDHPHVVNFRGAFYDETRGEPVLVMERMRENLREFLERNRNELSPQKQLMICLEIARGLLFLHTHTPPIVHRDLTDKNVMLGKDGLVKIGDLGQSKLKANNAQYFSTVQPGAIPFMPPEAMRKEAHYNEKLDTFSFGVLMLEVATQQPPQVDLVGIGRDKEAMRRKEDLYKLEKGHPLKPLILSCLEDEPEMRPDSMSIHTQLQAMVEGVEEVLHQFLLCPSPEMKVQIMKLPDMPIRATSFGATLHNSKVYISAASNDASGKRTRPILVYSNNELKWSTLAEQQGASTIAVVNGHITLIGGHSASTRKVISKLSTWYENEARWKRVMPPMPTKRYSPAAITVDNLLLVTGGVADDGSTVLSTTDVLFLTTMNWTSPEGLKLPVPLWQHHLALCGEYIYLVGGATVHPWQSAENDNPQAWRAKLSDIEQAAFPHHSQPQRGVWARIADPPTLRPAAVSCGGTLYTVGGRTKANKPISTVYTYNTAMCKWVAVGAMSVERICHCAVPLSRTTIFVAGGHVLHEGKLSTYSRSTELLLL